MAGRRGRRGVGHPAWRGETVTPGGGTYTVRFLPRRAAPALHRLGVDLDGAGETPGNRASVPAAPRCAFTPWVPRTPKRPQ